MESPGQPEDIVSSARLETFADGVFAIAITLLVLEIRIPEPGENVARAIFVQWPSFLAYVTSFITIGTMWANHHRIFTVISGKGGVRLDGFPRRGQPWPGHRQGRVPDVRDAP